MKSENMIKEVFGENGLLAKSIPNYKVRPQQVELAQKIYESIQTETPVIGEAPTGVGKSLAALVPAFAHIKRTGEAVVVVTSNITLQEQYILKDIPILEGLLDMDVSPVLIKGRNNYVCVKKQDMKRRGKTNLTTSEQVKQFEEVQKWAAYTKTGDKSELSFVPSFPVWNEFACIDSTECNGKGCSFYNNCHYYRERNKVNASKLVVCNYHYLFSAMGTDSQMLPADTKVLIMDEGHEVSDIARGFQEMRYHHKVYRNHVDLTAKAAEASTGAVGAIEFLYEIGWEDIEYTMTEMMVKLSHEYKKKPDPYRDFWIMDVNARTRLQEVVKKHIESISAAYERIENYLDKYDFTIDQLGYFQNAYGDEDTNWFMTLYQTADYLFGKQKLLEYLFAFDESLRRTDQEEIIWLQPFQDNYVSIHSKPLSGAGLMKRFFNGSNEKTTVLMSATLSASGNFNHIKKSLGIEPETKVNEVLVSSPFDLSENLLWYLPPDTPEAIGRNKQIHTPFTLDYMTRIIKELGGKTLCLFTSNEGMKAAEDYFKMKLPRNIQVVSQQQMPKAKIIQKMRQEDNVVVIATRSFFTGVDIQGHHLSAVLLDKLPFPMIGDPVNDTLSEKPNGFNLYTLPDTIIALKQAFGRLNRTMSDKGIVACFDGRLMTKGYRGKIFASFDFKVKATKSWDDVLDYIEEIKKDWEPVKKDKPEEKVEIEGNLF